MSKQQPANRARQLEMAKGNVCNNCGHKHFQMMWPNALQELTNVFNTHTHKKSYEMKIKNLYETETKKIKKKPDKICE